ncbi:MAG: hypothetical protein R3330_16930 [Saprospiraceae bacterium]|nr:hypothetical protein [Saprospiraceae bacterium]
MTNSGRPLPILIAIASLLVVGCSASRHLPTPQTFRQHVKGLYFVVTDPPLHQHGNKTRYLQGEMIAITADTLYLLEPDSAHVYPLARAFVNTGSVHVALSTEHPESLGWISVLANLSVIGHGYYLAFTLPLNAIATGVVGANMNEPYQVLYPAMIEWEQLRKFARFPQGIPAGISLDEIQ